MGEFWQAHGPISDTLYIVSPKKTSPPIFQKKAAQKLGKPVRPFYLCSRSGRGAQQSGRLGRKLQEISKNILRFQKSLLPLRSLLKKGGRQAEGRGSGQGGQAWKKTEKNLRKTCPKRKGIVPLQSARKKAVREQPSKKRFGLGATGR